MVDYIKTRKEILIVFYGIFSEDTLYSLPKEEIANALDEILLDDVKFKYATNELTPLIRAALKESIKEIVCHEIYLKTGIYKGMNPVNKLVKLWKGE